MTGVNITFSVHPGAELEIGTFYAQCGEYADRMIKIFGHDNVEQLAFRSCMEFMIETENESKFTLFMIMYPPSQYYLIITGICIEELVDVKM